MHVGINAQLLSFAPSYRSAGISRYIYHLLAELARLPTSHCLTAFVPDLPPGGVPWQGTGVRLRPSEWPTYRPIARIAWEQLVLPALRPRLGIDLLHATGYVAPLAWQGPLVVTVCDLSFIRFPQLFNRGNRLYLRLLTALTTRRARKVLTISEHTRRDVIQLLHLPPERVVTTYCGVGASFRPLPPAEIQAYRRARGLPERFILYLGTLEPRKNLPTLIRAYARLRSAGVGGHTLVLAGAPGWQHEAISRLLVAHRLGEHVRLLGYVDPEELALCYNAADLFVYPSLYEGFGLPVLEAMACGTPVVSSNAASLPEVVGEAGLLVDPLDESQLAEAIGRALNDAGLRARLRQAGLERARRFSWTAMAEQTLDIYQQELAVASYPGV